jgi:hypothetical protein
MPSVFVTVRRDTPVATSVALTAAFGTLAPEESVMVPSSVAVTACDHAHTGVKSTRSTMSLVGI